MRDDHFNLRLSKCDFIQILKACEDRAAGLDARQRASRDEDEVAEAGNDLVEAKLVMHQLKVQADEA